MGEIGEGGRVEERREGKREGEDRREGRRRGGRERRCTHVLH